MYPTGKNIHAKWAQRIAIWKGQYREHNQMLHAKCPNNQMDYLKSEKKMTCIFR
jgi:hypothetical protein